jgi:hypothetical protein
MRAPVYRHVEGQSTVAGVGLNAFIGLLGASLVAIQFLPFLWSLVAIATAYGLVRLAGRGKPPLYWQHLAVFHVRRAAAGGRLSAAARCRVPQFSHGPYVSRDVGRQF